MRLCDTDDLGVVCWWMFDSNGDGDGAQYLRPVPMSQLAVLALHITSQHCFAFATFDDPYIGEQLCLMSTPNMFNQHHLRGRSGSVMHCLLLSLRRWIAELGRLDLSPLQSQRRSLTRSCLS